MNYRYLYRTQISQLAFKIILIMQFSFWDVFIVVFCLFLLFSFMEVIQVPLPTE